MSFRCLVFMNDARSMKTLCSRLRALRKDGVTGMIPRSSGLSLYILERHQSPEDSMANIKIGHTQSTRYLFEIRKSSFRKYSMPKFH